MELSETAQDIISTLPAHYRDDPVVHAVIEPVARELDRLQAVAERVREKALPISSDDEFGFLSHWEGLLGLPVAPEELSITQRRERVMARFRSRRVASGSSWTERIDEMVGSAWRVVEQEDDYEIIITVPFDETQGAARLNVIEAFARKITPANTQITMALEEGFLVGISEVGDAI